jgi:hypothetical protein
MSAVIHLRCDRCGAPADGSSGWVRCDSCGTTAGFNFSGWTESPAFLEFQRRAMHDPLSYVERWKIHEAELQRAVSLHPASEALEIAAVQGAWVLNETPWVMPPRALEEDVRKDYERWLGFELLHYRLPGRIRDLYGQLNQATAAIGFGANENPLPAFRRMISILRELLEARYSAGSPPDPEGLSIDARLRLIVSMMVASYLRMVSPELQYELLREIYGPDSIELSRAGKQDYSVYFDWECPQCGLFSPQAVGSDKLTCPGCYAARVYGATLEIGAIAALCHGCGSRVEIGAGEMLAACGYCTSQVQRFVRAGDAQRTLAAEMKAKYAKQYGYGLAEVNAESIGFGCTPETREQRLRDGLVRISQWYHQFITPARYLGFAKASRPAAVEALLAAVLKQAESESTPAPACQLIEAVIKRATDLA